MPSEIAWKMGTRPIQPKAKANSLSLSLGLHGTGINQSSPTKRRCFRLVCTRPYVQIDIQPIWIHCITISLCWKSQFFIHRRFEFMLNQKFIILSVVGFVISGSNVFHCPYLCVEIIWSFSTPIDLPCPTSATHRNLRFIAFLKNIYNQLKAFYD